MAHLSLILSFILSLLPVALCTDVLSLFGPSLSPGAEVFSTSDVEYTLNITQRWDKFSEPGYIGATKPVTEQDVQKIVRVQRLCLLQCLY